MQIGLVRQHHVLVPLYVKKVAERPLIKKWGEFSICSSVAIWHIQFGHTIQACSWRRCQGECCRGGV